MIVAVACAFAPYVLIRGPVTRLAIDAGRVEQGADEVIRDEARLLTAIGKPTVK